MLAILLTGFVYVSAAVPWIIHRKTGRHLAVAFGALAGRALGGCLNIESYSTLAELFSFARRDFHPDQLIKKSFAGGIE
jgi:hypothetical protein